MNFIEFTKNLKSTSIWVTLVLALTSFSTALSDEQIESSTNQNSVFQYEDRSTDIAHDLQEACVSLRSTATGQWGSGVVVSERGLIFSVAHNFSGKIGEVVHVFQNDTPKRSAKVEKIDKKLDLAVLRIAGNSAEEFAAISVDLVSDNANTFLAAGHTRGFNSFREAPVRLGHGFLSDNEKFVVSTCTINIGDSGGPLFNLNGSLIGIHASMDGKGDFSLHIPIINFFNRWPNLYENDQLELRTKDRQSIEAESTDQSEI